MGIAEQDWDKIKSIVVEIHDVDQRLKKVEALLREKKFVHFTAEQEEGLENSHMYNLFALK
jgi:hypothetical protein